MAFNTAEGAGEFAKKEKARFYRMALRSSTEPHAIVDVIFGFGFIGADLYDQADRMLDRCYVDEAGTTTRRYRDTQRNRCGS